VNVYTNFREIENKINAAMKETPNMEGHVPGGAGHLPPPLPLPYALPHLTLIPNPTPTPSFILALSPSSASTSDPTDIPSSELDPKTRTTYTQATALTLENGDLEDGLPSSLPAFPTLSTPPPLPFTQVADAPSSRPPAKKRCLLEVPAKEM
jgi:hypothetical protein